MPDWVLALACTKRSKNHNVSLSSEILSAAVQELRDKLLCKVAKCIFQAAGLSHNEGPLHRDKVGIYESCRYAVDVM